MSDEILDYCLTGDEKESAAYHKILVSTCANVGQLYELGNW